jgi:carbon starvation protein
MAHMFAGVLKSRAALALWYHFAIMFEALFILTTIDAGTRVARYVLQELLGRVHPKFSRTAWLPGNLLATALVVLGWGYLIFTGTISTIWPMFGTGNQLLATIALAVATTFLINMGKARYAWLTAVPMCFVGVTTVTAGVLAIATIFWPLTAVPGQALTGYLDTGLMVIFIVGVVVVVGDAARQWRAVLRGGLIPKEAFGPPSETAPGGGMRCC